MCEIFNRNLPQAEQKQHIYQDMPGAIPLFHVDCKWLKTRNYKQLTYKNLPALEKPERAAQTLPTS
jgi:hypothetical protein